MTAEPDPRVLLAAERDAALARLAALEREFSAIVDAAGAANADDEHDPEGATLAFERQHVAALLTQVREQLAQVDAAIGRLDDGSYGRSVLSGDPIPDARLDADPAAELTVEEARARQES